ncbi:DUF1624 domain-containing protein [Candidatus Woesearchaeota archaeon]|nr:DUF1624 domain-containing protein [Candidatus Woesearchaeota archaeon]HIH37928.1 DUF1624 domain-containing protein [Candidatus Woesearchaeota archaeon]HIH48960.1 DUF1624 domain-containing protein [Candidatus Woesearchaeota archaeon]HIJ03614.1 DUF1624 domain-containing protein [Candidatus Woesearchaeota archaeon]
MQRFWEIDALRGIAIFMMVIYHTLYDLAVFGQVSIDVLHGFWRYFARATAILFLLLLGISAAVSLQRGRAHKVFFKRGLIVFGWGMLITLVTYLLLHEGFVIFGILHLIGISIILLPFFHDKKVFTSLTIILLLVLPFLFPFIQAGSIPLIPFGLPPSDFYSVDYYPLIPWFGVILLGLLAGNFLYHNGKRAYSVKKFSFLPLTPLTTPLTTLTSALGFMGKHSLAIYLLHQPIIIALLSMAGIISL